MSDFEEFSLGEQNQNIDIDTREQTIDASLRLAQLAHHSILLQSYDLDNLIYNSKIFCEAIKSVAIENQRSFVQILISDTKNVVLNGHQLVDLARRLSSHIEIRKLNPQQKIFVGSYLIADNTGYINRREANRYEGIVNFNNPAECRSLQNTFDDYWEKAIPASELKNLHL